MNSAAAVRRQKGAGRGASFAFRSIRVDAAKVGGRAQLGLIEQRGSVPERTCVEGRLSGVTRDRFATEGDASSSATRRVER